MKSLLLFLFLLLLSTVTLAAVQGVVTDCQTLEPVPFVNVVVKHSRVGVMTDIDGFFTVQAAASDTLMFSCVGYERTEVPCRAGDSVLRISLTPSVITLAEAVIFAGENPAHRIIRQAMLNKRINDPDNYSAFSYKAYDKMIFTVDTTMAESIQRSEGDSSGRKFREFLDRQHLLIVETVTEKTARNGRAMEKILGTRVSGLENPLFVFLLSQLQSGSLYNDRINLLDVSYISPLANGALTKYFFSLEDTIVRSKASDSTFVIAYRPRKGTNFDGLSGLLYINTHKYALENATAVPADTNSLMGIAIRHKYQRMGEMWFPEQIHTDLLLYSVLLQAGDKQAYITGRGKRYIREVSLAAYEVEPPRGAFAVEMASDATFKGKKRVDEQRPLPLTAKDRETYRVLDSIGKEENFDRKLQSVSMWVNGMMPVGFVNLDILSLMRYNPFSGYSPGLYLETNNRLSPWFSWSVFGAYGFKDKLFKYGTEVSLLFDSRCDGRLQSGYHYDLTEPGKFSADAFPLHRTDDFLRNYSIDVFDRTENVFFSVSFRTLRWIQMQVKYQYQFVDASPDYQFYKKLETVTLSGSQFIFNTLEANLRFAFREKLMQSPRGVISGGTDFPVFEIAYRRGFDGILAGEYPFHRVEAVLRFSQDFTWLGKSVIMIRGGMVSSDVPRQQLFNGNGTLSLPALYAPFTFATMRPGTFFSDKYIALYLSHSFKNLLFGSGWFRPEPELVFNGLLGALNYPELHNLPFLIPDKGYFETGLLLNNLLGKEFGVGAGVFMRTGYYASDRWKENLAFKIILTLP